METRSSTDCVRLENLQAVPSPKTPGVLGKNRSKQMAFEHKASSKTKPSRQETLAMKKVEQDF